MFLFKFEQEHVPRSFKTFKITSKALSKIGKNAFKGCKKLKKVNVKNSKKAAYKKLFTKKNCGKKVKLT